MRLALLRKIYPQAAALRKAEINSTAGELFRTVGAGTAYDAAGTAMEVFTQQFQSTCPVLCT